MFYLRFLWVFEGCLARPAAVEAGRRPPATLKTLFYLRFLIVFVKNLFYLRFLMVFESHLACGAASQPVQKSCFT